MQLFIQQLTLRLTGMLQITTRGWLHRPYKVANYFNTTWSYPTTSGTPTTSQVQATGVASTGDFTVGEITACTISSGFNYASSNLCSNAGIVYITLNLQVPALFSFNTPAGFL